MKDESLWWSVAPENHEKILKEDPLYQVLWQVMEINKQIKKFQVTYEPSYIEISYENLCANPKKEINNIYKELGLLTPMNNLDKEVVVNNNQIVLNPEEWEKLSCFYKKLNASDFEGKSISSDPLAG